ncbi:hypothetical protein [Dictyobacter aurantiacus]|uniref:Uncharacterized protein n=1 Tax=Dictyobacter aurantiacus TaxID=1936993 RepID=A0A401ZD58_9CHLR|nr:hypothetical protein [Dictyobacter aurantiacus]GCE04773.1 hypothetical protein KDAU_21020 [Dictyobacter aurantiacus]
MFKSILDLYRSPSTGELSPLERDPNVCCGCDEPYCDGCGSCHTPGCRYVRVVCAQAQDAIMNVPRGSEPPPRRRWF